MSNTTKTIKFTVESIARVYVNIKLNNKYNAKLLVSDQTKDLEVGQEYELPAEDLSIKTKYGTELKFRLIDETNDQKVVLFKNNRVNTLLNDQLKALGGKWDAQEKVWVLPAAVEKQVEDLDALFNSEEITVKAIFTTNIEESVISVLGYHLIKLKFGRDEGVVLFDNVSILSGEIESSGSRKNPHVSVSQGAVVSFKVPKKVFEKYKENHKDIILEVI